MRFHFGWKSHFGVQSALYLCSHKLRRNETQSGMDFIWISYRSFWPKWNFKPAWDFHVNIIYPKQNEKAQARWMLCLIPMYVWNSCRYGFHIGNFDKKWNSFRVIKYYVNTTGNEMPTHVHQNIRSFWNAAEMKLHVNKTCFQAGLKSQTGMSSFRLSCERTHRFRHF